MSGAVHTLTFLFTDIEGSTRLWERHPEAMRGTLTRHDTLLRQAIESHGGRVFKTIGDAFCAAFPGASAGLAAAVAAQQSLLAEPWPEGLGIRARMALHSGDAEERGGDYFGPALNRCSRMLAAGHGGQILVSASAEVLLRSSLSEGVGLLDLGEHRLKDLVRPERIFQVIHPLLPSEFHPLRSLASFSHNLAVQLSSFVGREQEMEEVHRLLAGTRLLTLIGAGGVGKTRLAIQVAADLLDEFADGAWLVEFAALSGASLLPQALAAALGIREEPQRPLLETLTDSLRAKDLLLIFDNCEHVVEGCAHLAQGLLSACPKVRVLATSRQALRVPGETIWKVPSLSAPDPAQLPPAGGDPVELADRWEAVRLFADRAAAADSRFALRKDNAAAVAKICWVLDGIPLAIELAAARVKVLSPDKIARRLDDRFQLLTGGARTALPRHQTLRAAVDWSYGLLHEKEKTAFNRLAVFAGGFTLEAVEDVCGGDGIKESEILDLLTELVEKSLVAAEEQDGEVRYRLLTTLRAYGQERLAERGESDRVAARHFEHFLRLAEEAEPRLDGPEQGEWLARLATEQGNFRAALDRGVEADPERALRLAAKLERFWSVRGHLAEGRDWLERGLAKSLGAPADLRAAALMAAGILAWRQGDYEPAGIRLEEGLTLHRRLGNKRGTANALNSLGNIATNQGNYAHARALYEQSLALRRETGDTRGVAGSLNNLGLVSHEQGDYPKARAYYEEAVRINRDIGNRAWEASGLNNLGNTALAEGDFEKARASHEEALGINRALSNRAGEALNLNNLGIVAAARGDSAAARAHYEEALRIRRDLGDKRGMAESLHDLAAVTLKQQGDPEAARALFEQALQLFREIGDQRGLAYSLEGFARIAQAKGDAARAARLFAAAAALRESIGAPLPPYEATPYRKDLDAVRAALGDAAFDAAWANGRALHTDSAIHSALGQ